MVIIISLIISYANVMCYKNYFSCHIFKDDGFWMLKVVNIRDEEETVWT